MMMDLALKATLLLAAAWVAAFALRSRAASTRHAIWAGVMAAALLLPLGAAFAPALELAVLPAAQTVPSAEPADPQVRFTAAQGRDADAPTSLVARPDAASDRSLASLSAAQWSLLLWLTMTVVLMMRLIIAQVHARGLLRGCAAPSTRVAAAAERVARALSIRRPRVAMASASTMPAVIGIVRPSVVLPADAESWEDERLELVLMHECAHVRRRDTLVQTISNIAAAAYWWHPLAWIAARHVVRERELACDDLVIASGTSADRYAEHLLAIARSMKASREPALAALAMARPSELEGRLISLLDHRPRGSRSSRALMACVLLSLAAGAIVAPLKLVARAAVVRDAAAVVREEIDTAQTVTHAQSQDAAAEADPAVNASQQPQTAPAPAPRPAPSPEIAQSVVAAAVIKAMHDEDADVRALAAAALVANGGEPSQVMPLLIRALEDPAADVRAAAALGLASLGRKEAAPALAAALKDVHADVRTAAALALGSVGDQSALPALSAAMSDASADVRKAVLAALTSIGGKRSDR